MMEDRYIFPLKTVEECVAFFRKCSNTQILEEDFRKPNASRWKLFYSALLKYMIGCHEDIVGECYLSPFARSIKYNELHEDSLPLFTFRLMMYHALQSASSVCKFTMLDLIEPKQKRLLCIVSGAMQYITFKQSRDCVFDRRKESLEREAAQFEKLQADNSELKDRQQVKLEQHTQTVATYKQLQEANVAVLKQVRESHKNVEMMNRHMAEIKNEVAQKNYLYEKMRGDNAELMLKKEMLYEHLVNSPDRLNAEKGRNLERIQGLKVDLAEKEDRMNKIHRKKADLIHMLEIVGKCKQDILAIECNNRSQTEAEKQIALQREERQALRSSQLCLATKREDLQQVLAKRQDKFTKLELCHHSKRSNLNENIAMLTRSKESSKSCNQPTLAGEMQCVQHQDCQEEHTMDELIDRSKRWFFDILQKVDKYNNRVADGLAHAMDILKNNP